MSLRQHVGKRRVVELFAGVGGFRLGLQGHPGSRAPGPWQVAWANQWEPGDRNQWAFQCYWARFHPGKPKALLSNTDIAVAAEMFREYPVALEPYELLVGGFPCQDYSVAKPLSQAHGIEGKKGVLWWDIYKFLSIPGRRPPFVLLENVDRLLKSPTHQRGRDFAIILACLRRIGYVVEWRVVNAADYGYAQRRRRVFLLARPPAIGDQDPHRAIHETGVLAQALGVRRACEALPPFHIDDDPHVITTSFPAEKRSPFMTAGLMVDGKVWTCKVQAKKHKKKTLGSVVSRTRSVPEEFYLPGDAETLRRWRELKGAKSVARESAGFEYRYSEGAMQFPDLLSEPARTVLTGEGGTSPSRFKHVVEDPLTGRLRRLVPDELEELNGFRRGWTEGMPDTKRAFMMGNALVVPVVRKIGMELDRVADDLLKGLA